MIVHHLNCGTCCPLGGRWLDGRSKGVFARMVCHVLLIETAAGLVLIDTGLGTEDVAHPWPRLSLSFLLANNFRLRRSETAIEQIRALGLNPAEVRHIILTHLDFDHAGGIADFPQALVHVTRTEFEVAQARMVTEGRRRYRPAQWAHAVRWQLYEPEGEPWHGFGAVRSLAGLPQDLLMVSLIGHTPGHAGIAIDTSKGWLLHAGDAYVHKAEMKLGAQLPRMAQYQGMLDCDRNQRLINRDRLRQLSQDPKAEVRVFCAHDPEELEALRNEQTRAQGR